MKKSIKLYYILLLIVITAKVATTIFSNGFAVHHGKKLAILSIQKENLVQQQMQLSSQLSYQSSLATITATTDLSEYEPIKNPVIISKSLTVASN